MAQACNLVIFGANGDLVRRKLLPSLYQLEKKHIIHPDTCIIGVGRSEWNSLFYRNNIVRSSLETFMLEPINERIWNIFSARFIFCNFDVNDLESFNILLKNMDSFIKQRVIIFYFAVPPNIFGIICKGLGAVGLNKRSSRVVMEKPFGVDLDSAKIINHQVSQYFNETQIYRIDHYLGKETVLNLLALRFSNALFTYNWDNHSIDHVQITVSEKVGIEGRWGYFDSIGQMRDMVQSHLLQILTIIAMSPPSNLTADCIRDEKVKILRALRIISCSNVYNVVRGQYISGLMNGEKVPGYLEESGSDATSCTETFVSIRVDIDNWRWAGVPFYLRTGKRLPVKSSEVVIFFKRPVLNLFSDSYKNLPNNKLTIRLQPDEGMDIQILNKIPGLGHKHRLQTTKLDLRFFEIFSKEGLIGSYERLLLEVMRGIQVLFVRRDEIENSWKWVDSIISAWNFGGDNSQLKFYKAGTWGPDDSRLLIERDGRKWSDGECNDF